MRKPFFSSCVNHMVSYSYKLIPDINRFIHSAIGNKLFFSYALTSLEKEEGIGHGALIEFGYHLLRDEHFPRLEACSYSGTDTRFSIVVRERSQSDTLLVGKNSPFSIDVECRLPWRSVSILAHPPGCTARWPDYKLGVDRIVVIEVRDFESLHFL